MEVVTTLPSPNSGLTDDVMLTYDVTDDVTRDVLGRGHAGDKFILANTFLSLTVFFWMTCMLMSCQSLSYALADCS